MKTLPLLTVILTLTLAVNGSAQTPGVSTLTVGGTYGGFTDSGYEFSINAPIQVTGLGFYDNYVNSDRPTVNLYNASGPGSGTLLASLTSTTGAGGNPNGLTYGLLATPVTLQAGTYEVVSSLYYTSNNDTVTINPALTLDKYVDGGGTSGFQGTFFTTQSAPTGAEANADIQFNIVAAPEPSTWAMLFSGLFALLCLHRFNRKNNL